MIVVVVLVSLVVGLAAFLPLALFWRCRQVDAARSQRLRDSYAQAAADMNAGEQSWEWRFDAYQKGPSFNQMVWQVWRPVSSFYQDTETDPAQLT